MLGRLRRAEAVSRGLAPGAPWPSLDRADAACVRVGGGVWRVACAPMREQLAAALADCTGALLRLHADTAAAARVCRASLARGRVFVEGAQRDDAEPGATGAWVDVSGALAWCEQPPEACATGGDVAAGAGGGVPSIVAIAVAAERCARVAARVASGCHVVAASAVVTGALRESPAAPRACRAAVLRATEVLRCAAAACDLAARWAANADCSAPPRGESRPPTSDPAVAALCAQFAAGCSRVRAELDA